MKALSALSNHAANLTSKLEAVLKHQENFLKKMKQIKCKDNRSAEMESSAKHSNKKRREISGENGSGKSCNAPIVTQRVDSTHCIAVIRGLLMLFLSMDHSCSADMFLLSCKVS